MTPEYKIIKNILDSNKQISDKTKLVRFWLSCFHILRTGMIVVMILLATSLVN